ncbi:MAG: condensin subunit Smc [Actinomycetia bacterium]|nr:condensin subunit Smc [Actinomycetes bacterium]
MFLKALTLRGFKSFADKTTLEFEQGVTVVVGPNGSGKSNLVDAVAWVLGAQGARALRGGKMDDVIFAGTSDRPALGRAEVALTIDNAAGLLPIEFSEVTITRTLFRTGESEYQINGVPCRLLDVQDLLSDSGIGRQQHVIVGQGQLDAVLNARSEDRRAVIEEAAGVLKYRKRKEKAERRLDATEGNLLRLTDLLREVRRQLRPLERQADAARRHDGLVAELRSVRLHLSGREIEQLRLRQTRRRASRAELTTQEHDVRVRLRALDASVLDAEKALARPGDDDLADVLARTEALRERARGLVALVSARQRAFERELAAVADEGVVETLVADAAALRIELAEVDADFASLAPTRAEVEAAEERVAAFRAELEAAAGEERSRSQEDVEATARAASAEHRDATHALEALESRGRELRAALDAVRAELADVTRATGELAPARIAAEELAARAASLRGEVDARDAVAPDLRPEARARQAAEEAVHAAETTRHAHEAEASRWQARAEALTLALQSAHAATNADALADIDGVAGPLVDHLAIEDGTELAVAAALGEALDAIVVAGGTAVRHAVERAKQGDVRALLLVVSGAAGAIASVPYGSRSLLECVRAPAPELEVLLTRLLGRTVLVGSWEQALDVVTAHPELVVVTPAGDRFGGLSPWRTGPPGAPAITPAAVDEAAQHAATALAAAGDAEHHLDAARMQLAAARRAELVASERERQHRAEMEQAEVAAADARREVEVREATLLERRSLLERRDAQLAEEQHGHPDTLAAARARLADTEAKVASATEAVAAAHRHEQSAADARRARRAELERLTAAASRLRRDFDVRGAGIEERRTLVARRLADVEARLAARPDEEAAARRRRALLAARQSVVAELDARLQERSGEVDALAERLRERRREQSEAAREAGRTLDSLRGERATAERELTEVRERVSRLEVEEAELRLRIETATEAIRRDFDCEPEAAIEAPAPDVGDGITLPARARELERELRIMGPVNPLALSEYESLLERHEFLQAQLEDVKNTRRELTRVIRAVDAEIISVFEAAFRDVAANFESLFSTLFPGGAGRLVLTDPDNLLDTGIEIEARPSGKTVRRLSLLSGGERSLTALAYLFSVFRARPSPFYLMDEVEAALDDVNLHRFLDLLHEFRGEAQLLVVSHQKRTMEAADVLYGVSMPPGGSSRVVSQRIRDLEFDRA